MTACTTTLGDTAGGLVCQRVDAHEPHRGCVFIGESGQVHVPKEGI